MDKPYIVKGYKGVMDLDLTHIPSKFHKEMITLHNQEIEEYKLDQLSRPERMRYDNTIGRALAYEEIVDTYRKKRCQEEEEKWMKKYMNQCAAIKIHQGSNNAK